MLWSDLNDHYFYKLMYYFYFAARRLTFAYVLTNFKEDGCLQVKMLMMVCASGLFMVTFLKPFKYGFF